MLSGTTSDQFFRYEMIDFFSEEFSSFSDNLEWLARATNWAKFTAAASLGVIHKGHIKEALNLMSAYLPKDSTGNSPYAEGGGLYALGLIHANHGGDIIDYLINQLRSNSTQTDVCEKICRSLNDDLCLDCSSWCMSWIRFSCNGHSA